MNILICKVDILMYLLKACSQEQVEGFVVTIKQILGVIVSIWGYHHHHYHYDHHLNHHHHHHYHQQNEEQERVLIVSPTGRLIFKKTEPTVPV